MRRLLACSRPIIAAWLISTMLTLATVVVALADGTGSPYPH